MTDEELTEKYFTKYLYALSNDGVVNVKITLAKVLSKELFKKSKIRKNNFLKFSENLWMLKNNNFITIVNKLKNDKNNIINSYFKNLTEEQLNIIDSSEDVFIDTSDVFFDNKMNILKETFGISRNLPLNSEISKKSVKVKQIKEENSENILDGNSSSLSDTSQDLTKMINSEESEDLLLKDVKKKINDS